MEDRERWGCILEINGKISSSTQNTAKIPFLFIYEVYNCEFSMSEMLGNHDFYLPGSLKQTVCTWTLLGLFNLLGSEFSDLQEVCLGKINRGVGLGEFVLYSQPSWAAFKSNLLMFTFSSLSMNLLNSYYAAGIVTTSMDKTDKAAVFKQLTF